MYQINEISNRDVSLLHYYRILKKPSDFLSAIYSDDEPIVSEIQSGTETDLATESGEPVYSYNLGMKSIADKIPYLEFDTDNEKDRKRLETLLYLDGSTIYSTLSEFSEPVLVNVYWVNSLEDVRQAIARYLQALGDLQIDPLRQMFEDKKNQPKALASIEGRENNLVEFVEGSNGLTMQDADYMITSALEAQMLVNPSQELLMSLPRKLKHNINISVTDSSTRYLSSFSGYTINIRGNGNWVIRDTDCGIDFVTGSGTVYLWNCRLVHFRNTVEAKGGDSTGYFCKKLHAHRSLVILNQGMLKDVYLIGGSTLVEIPLIISLTEKKVHIEHVSLIGYGCSLYSWSKPVPVDVSKILGLAWWLEMGKNSLSYTNAMYIAGKRIDEVGGEHDAELNPSQVVEYNAGNIHIRTGGD